MDAIKKQEGSEAACEATSEAAITTVPDRDLSRSPSPFPVCTPSPMSARIRARSPPTVPLLDHQQRQSHRAPIACTVDTTSGSDGEFDPFDSGPTKNLDIFPTDMHNNGIRITDKKKALKDRDFIPL